MKQSIFLLAALSIAAAGFFTGCQAPGGTEQKPNIIFIMADDLGYGDLESFGQKVINTPQFNKMSTEGIRFTQHYAGNTVCAPSRCSLMTGFHMGHAEVRGNKQAEPSGRIVLNWLNTDSIIIWSSWMKEENLFFKYNYTNG